MIPLCEFIYIQVVDNCLKKDFKVINLLVIHRIFLTSCGIESSIILFYLSEDCNNGHALYTPIQITNQRAPGNKRYVICFFSNL